MAGCFGNSAEDRYFEKQLNDYLDSQEIHSVCEECELEDEKEWQECGKCADDCRTGQLKEYEPDYDQMNEDREEARQARFERFYP